MTRLHRVLCAGYKPVLARVGSPGMGLRWQSSDTKNQGSVSKTTRGVSPYDATVSGTHVPVEPHDPSDDTPVLTADVISEAPDELHARTVRIFQPCKTAMQSGVEQTKYWRLDWDIDPKLHRWNDPLIGWESSGDYMQGNHVKFLSAEDAIRFCEKQGWDYFVQQPHMRAFKTKAYASNFKMNPRKIAHCK